jgi:hypothetical protein
VDVRWLVAIAAAACGAPRSPAPPSSRAPTPLDAPRALDLDDRNTYWFRTTVAKRDTRFQLVAFADEKTVIEEYETDDAQPRRRLRGWRRRNRDGTFDLGLTTDDEQPLQLHCVPRTVPISAAGATLACGAWTPPDRPPLAVLACGGAGEPDDESLDDDDDRLVFAPAPGVERVVARGDGCPRSSGLRRAR